MCTDTTFAMVFPEGQHDGQYVTTLVMRDSVLIAARPEVVAEYIDSTGTGVVYMGDSVVWLRTNGRDSLWLCLQYCIMAPSQRNSVLVSQMNHGQ